MRTGRASFVACFALVSACSGGSTNTTPDASSDGSAETTPVEHEPPCGADPSVTGAPPPSTRVATIAPRLPTLAKAGPANPSLDHDALMTYVSSGLGDTIAGPSEPGVLVDDLLPGGATSVGVTGARSLAFIAHLSDFQLVDDESPSRVMSFDNPELPGAARPQEGGVALAVSAMHRTLKEISRSRPFDLEIVTGDCADSAQQNELAWFVQLMDGGPGLFIDSGDKDDPVVGPGNDVKDPFDPYPSPAPWYFVFGNHDTEVQGSSVPDVSTRDLATGTQAFSGARDYRRKYAPPSTDLIPADPKRAQLTRAETIAAVLASKGAPGPAGHGFAAGASSAHWVADPIAGVSLRLVELDTTSRFGGSDGMVERATVNAFLEPTLAKADADHVLVILASHHATTEITTKRGLDSTTWPDAVPASELEATVAKHPSVILWLVGHDHRNRIRAIKGPSAEAPGYYEIMTDAIADWPSQARAIELVYVAGAGAGTLSIFTSMIDYQARTCLEERFRNWSLCDVNSGYSKSGAGSATDRNVELLRAVPAGVALGGEGATKIETTTTLSGR